MLRAQNSLMLFLAVLAIVYGASSTVWSQVPTTQLSGDSFRQAKYNYLVAQAKSGNTDAQAELGLRIFDGVGVQSNYKDAIQWLQQAAERGSERARMGLGTAYCFGQGVQSDPVKGISMLTEAASSGVAHADTVLGKIYHDGKLVPKDDLQAFRHMLRAAQAGDRLAEYRLGLHYIHGWGAVPDGKQAVLWLESAAEGGDIEAVETLGFVYTMGEPGLQKDDAKALSYLRKSALLNMAYSQFLLGLHYENGTGVPIDYCAATALYRSAARLGSIAAMKAVEKIDKAVPATQPNLFQEVYDY